MNQRTITLVPLTPREVFEDQVRSKYRLKRKMSEPKGWKNKIIEESKREKRNTLKGPKIKQSSMRQ